MGTYGWPAPASSVAAPQQALYDRDQPGLVDEKYLGQSSTGLATLTTVAGVGTLGSVAYGANGTFLGMVAGGPAFAALTGASLSGFTSTHVPYAHTDGTLTASAELTYATATGSLDVAKARSGGTVTTSARNTSNTASSGARQLVEVAGASAGDPSLRLSIAGIQDWDLLIDNATSDQAQLKAGSTVVQRWSTAGDVAIGGAIDTTYRLKILKAANCQVFIHGNVSGGFGGLRVGAGESEAAIAEGYANDAAGSLVGVTKANRSYFYSASGHTGVVLGCLKSDGEIFLSPGNALAATIRASRTIASAAGATWDGWDIMAATATVSGSTNITTAAGFNYVTLRQPTISAALALTITNAATLYVANAPAAAGAGPATITNAYAIWVDAGLVRLDGNGTHVLELPADATAGAGPVTGRVPIKVGGALKYLRYFDD